MEKNILFTTEKLVFFAEKRSLKNSTYRGDSDKTFLDKSRLNIFAKILEKLDSEKEEYIIVFPPFAPDLFLHMTKNDKKIVDSFNFVVEQMKGFAGKKVFDFHNPFSIQTNDCEFLDGDHPGQIAVARLLLRLKDSRVEHLLKISYIENDIASNEGRTVSPAELDRYMPKQKEVDFLNIGCIK